MVTIPIHPKAVWLILLAGFAGIWMPGRVDAQCSYLSPADGATVISGASVLFDWADIPGATLYELDIATDAQFNNIIFQDTTAVSQMSLTLTGSGTLYWVVVYTDGYSTYICPNYSVLTVTSGPSPTPTATPTPTGPANIAVQPASLAFEVDKLKGRVATSITSATAEAGLALETKGAAGPTIEEAGDPARAERTIRDGVRLWHLEEVPTLAMARFRNAADLKDLQSLAGSAAALRGLESHRRNPARDLSLVRATPGTELHRAALGGGKSLDRQLAALDEVTFTGPVYRVGERYVGVGDTVNLQFRPEIPPEEQSRLLGEFGAEVVEAPTTLAGRWLVRVVGNDGRVTLDTAEALASMPELEYATPDWFSMYQVYGSAGPAGAAADAPVNDPLYSQQWHLLAQSYPAIAEADMNVPSAWTITNGHSDVVIGVIDDGVQMTHEDLNVIAGKDELDGSADCNPEGNDSHGTSVAGVIAAKANNGLGGSGVTHGLKVVGVRLIAGAAISDSQIANAFKFCVDNGAWLINNSWGASYPFDFCSTADDTLSIPISTTVANAFADALTRGRGGKGSLILFAAGNARANVDGDQQNSHPDVVCVAASNNVAKRSTYSNYGTKIDVCAPSNDADRDRSCGVFDGEKCTAGIACFDQIWTGGMLGITTTDLTGSAGSDPGNYTSGFGGTSSACPAVAGVAALVMSANPQLTWQQVKNILETTTEKIDPTGGAYDVNGHSIYYGYGKVDAFAAVQKAIGNVRTQSLLIRNTGGAALTLGQIARESGAVWLNLSQAPANGATLQPGQSVGFEVSVQEGTLGDGTYNDAILIPSNDPDTPSLRVPVSLTITNATAPTPTPSPSPTTTAAPTASPTPTPESTITATATATATITSTPSETPTATPSPTASASPTATPSPSISPSPTASATPSPSPSPTPPPPSVIRDFITRRALILPSEQAASELNGDGVVDVADMVRLLRASPTATASPTSSPTPSPTAGPTSTITFTPTPTLTPTATATPFLSPTPSPSLSPTPTGTSGPTVQKLIQEQFASSSDGTLMAVEMIEIAAQAAFGAKDLNGGAWTYTGTLTQAAPNSNSWTYSPAPTDKLIVQFSGAQPIEIKYTTFNGYVDGGWEKFVDSHSLDFTFKSAGSLDVRIQSVAQPAKNAREIAGPVTAGYTYDIQFQRRITGTMPSQGELLTVDITNQGTKKGYVESPFLYYEYNIQAGGTMQSPSGSITIAEQYSSSYSYDSRKYHHVFNRQITNNSTAVRDGVTYQFQNANVRWEYESVYGDTVYVNVVRQPDYWIVQGSLLANGQVIGNLQLTGPIIINTHGPDLVLRMTSGEDYFLHTLIQYP
jgi:subtilisin family serine protease